MNRETIQKNFETHSFIELLDNFKLLVSKDDDELLKIDNHLKQLTLYEVQTLYRQLKCIALNIHDLTQWNHERELEKKDEQIADLEERLIKVKKLTGDLLYD